VLSGQLSASVMPHPRPDPLVSSSSLRMLDMATMPRGSMDMASWSSLELVTSHKAHVIRHKSQVRATRHKAPRVERKLEGGGCRPAGPSTQAAVRMQQAHEAVAQPRG